MNYYKLKFEDNTIKIVKAKNILALIKEHDLATREHINTVIQQLSGEQLAIAKANI